MTGADDVIREALLRGLPVDSRRRQSHTPAECPQRVDKPAPALPELDDPFHPLDDIPIETLDWIDGRLMLVVDQTVTKGRTDETRTTGLQPNPGPAGPDS